MGHQIPYVYVYGTTYLGQGDVLEKPKDVQNCVIMGRKSTLNFLGPFSELYLVARNLSNKLEEANKQTPKKESKKLTKKPNKPKTPKKDPKK